MTREEEQQMLRYGRGLYNVQVRNPRIALKVLLCFFAVPMALGALAFLLHLLGF